MTVLDVKSYFTDIPFDKYEIDINKIIEINSIKLKSTLVEFINTRTVISFNSNVWDFNCYFDEKDTAAKKISFLKTHIEILEYLKLYVVYSILTGISIRTLRNRVSSISVIYNDIKKIHDNKTFYSITKDDIVLAIENSGNKLRTKGEKYRNVLSFIEFCTEVLKLKFTIKHSDIIVCNDIYDNHNYKMKNKTKYMEQHYFNEIRETFYKILKDEQARFKYRMTAGLLLILTQTGLRVSELVNLLDISFYSDIQEGIELHFVKVNTVKSARGHTSYRIRNIFVTNYCWDVYNEMLKIKKSYNIQSKYLYVTKLDNNDSSSANVDSFRSLYRSMMKLFMYKQCSKEQIGVKPTLYENEYLYIPSFHQYRLFYCTYLFNIGVGPALVESFLGHVSSEMSMYYTVPSENITKKTNVIEEFLEKLNQEDVDKLKNYSENNVLYENVKDTITRLNVNVKDSKAITALSKMFDVSLKVGGYCIRRKGQSCQHDFSLENYNCCYNGNGDTLVFYFNLNCYYEDFKAALEQYKQYELEGSTPLKEKVVNHIKTIVRDWILPMIDELESIIESKGASYVKEKHKQLSYIIDNLSTIKGEVSLWN